MEFKKTVAGISAAAIAVTQVAAVIPMGAFAATTAVDSANVQFALNYKAGGKTNSVTAAAGDKTATVNAADITSVDGFGLSFSGAITGTDLADGDKYTFTADGLTVTAKEKDTKSIDKTGTVFAEADGVDLDGTTVAGKLDVDNAGAEGDTVTITYTKGETDIKVADSKGANITNTASESEEGKFTFVLTADSASKFTVSGDGVTVGSVKVTKKTETQLSIGNRALTTEIGDRTVIATGGAVRDKVTVTFEETPGYSAESGPLSLTIAGDDVSSSPYTFELTADMVENGFKVSGNGYTISEIKLVHTEEADLNKSGEIKDTKTPATVTVEAKKFADVALVDGSALTVETVKTGANNGTITIKAGEVVITDGTEHAASYTLNADQAAAVKANGLTITGSGIKLARVGYRVKGETTKGQTITLFEGSESVVWSETYASETKTWETLAEDTEKTTVSTASLTLGTLEAFQDKYENITATWSGLTAVKVTPDPVEPTEVQGTLPFSTETDLSKNYIKFGAVEGAAKDGTITVGVKDTDGAAVVLKDADGVQLDTKTVADSETSVVFTLTEEQAAKVAKGFIIAGTKGTVTSVAYKAKEEEKPTEKTTVTKDIGFTDADGIDLADNKIKINASEMAADGKITVTLKANVTNEIALKSVAEGNEVIVKAAPETDATEVVFTLTADQAAKAANGFIIEADAGVVTGVAYKAKEDEKPEDDTKTVGWTDETGIVLYGNTSITFKPYTNDIMKAGNKLEIKYSGKVNGAYVTLTDLNGKEVDRVTLQDWDGAEGTASFILTDKSIAALAKGFKISGEKLTVKGVNYAPYFKCVSFDNNFDGDKYQTSALKDVKSVEIKFNVTVCDPDAFANIKFYAQNDDWNQYIYASPKREKADWFNANLKGTGEITVKLPLDVSKSNWYTIAAETSDYTAIDGTLVSIKFLDKDGKAVKTYTDPSAAPVEEEIKITDITKDTNFQKVLKAYDADNNGKLSESEIAEITDLGNKKADEKFKDEAANLAKVVNFKGIEKLTALKSLIVNNNTQKNFKTLDLSKNEALTFIDVSGCTNLAKLDPPATDAVETLLLQKTAIAAVYVSGYTGLKVLNVSDTKLTALNVSTNTELETLALKNVKVNELYVADNTKLKTLDAANCGLTKIDVSANTLLEDLDVSGNSLITLDLTGLTALTADKFKADNNKRNIGTVIDNTYDLKDLVAEGLVVDNMTITTEGVTRNENVLTGVKGDVTYTYETGLKTEGLDKVTFTLAPEKVTSDNFEVSYMNGEEKKSVVCETWDEVLKTMADKNVDYTVEVKKDVEVDNLKMPTAAKAKSVTVACTGNTITTKSASVTLPTNTKLENVKIKALDSKDKEGKTLAKTFTLNASKNLTVAGGLVIEAKASTIKGGAKSVLETVQSDNEFNSAITGFGTVLVDNGAVKFNNTVKVKELDVKNGSVVEIGKNAAVTVTNITSNGRTASKLVYTDAEYKPVAVTGNISGETKLEVGISYKKPTTTVSRFAKGDVVLVSKNANLAAVDASESLPEGTTLGRDKSDIKVMDIVATMNGVEYAQWSDITSTIAAVAKADKNFAKTAVYDITLSKELDAKGALKMPAAGTFGELVIKSDAAPQTIKFTGNLTLTGKTTFENVNLDSVKTVKGVSTSYDFSISAAKNELTLNSVTTEKSIKTITSSGVVNLDRVTVGTVTAATVNVTKTTSVVPGAGAINDEEKTWEGKDVVASSVTVTGNLTAKTALNLNGDNASLTVKGVVNAMSIEAEKDTATLAVYTQPKGKNALVIGKNGVTAASKSLKFVLVDRDSGKTAHITEDVVLGTIAGTYADEFVPSNDNLDTEDSYYILKSGKNLIAKSKTAAKDYVEVKINGKTARYKTVDEAIKDISATGKSTDVVEITITDKTFKDAVAKLPLPAAGKYKELTYKADDAVTVKVTGDLALTGNLVLDNVDIEKVTKDGKSTAALNVNVGKYELITSGCYLNKTADAAEGSGEYSAVANISGTGKFTTGIDIVVSGKVNGTTLVLKNSKVTLDGDRAAFTGSIEANRDCTFSYTNAKNVKFVNISSDNASSLKLDGAAVTEDAVLASITGDYTKDAVVVDGELKVVRSGNTLKAVKAENVVEVKAYSNETEFEEENVDKVRAYDSVASAMNDISRIKNKEACYKVAVKTGDVLVLPKANTYRGIELTADKAAEITTAKDLTLTGMLILGENVTLNKADKKAMTVKLGSYSLMIDKDAHVAYDAEKNVSQFVNIDGSKGGFFADGDITVSGKVNVGYFKAPKTTLADNASFAAAIIIAEGGESLDYNVKIANKVKIGNILGKGNIVLNVGGEIADKQIAVLTGNYRADSVTIGDGETYVAVPKGNKLMAVAKAKAKVAALTLDGETTYLFDTYENAVKAVAKLGDAKTEIEIDVTDVQPVSGKLALPTKGKYETLTITSEKAVTLKVNSDITLTGNLVIGGKVTLQKKEGTAKDLLKFKSATDKKTKKALYTVTVVDDAKVVNGSVNGEPIVNPTPVTGEEKTEMIGTLDYSGSVDLALYVLKIEAKSDVAAKGTITVTLQEAVENSIEFKKLANGEAIKTVEPTSGSNTYTWELSDEDAAFIKENGFYICGTAGVITSVTYTEPTAPTTPEAKGAYEGSLNYNGDGIDLSRFVLWINKKAVVENGTITVTLKEEVTSSVIFKKTNRTDVIKTVAPTSGSTTYTWVLSADDAAYIAENGFVIDGTEGVLTSVTYTAPEIPGIDD